MRKHGVSVFGQARVSARGGGGYVHQNHEKPNTLVKKVVQEFDRGTRGRFLCKAVPRHGGGGEKI